MYHTNTNFRRNKKGVSDRLDIRREESLVDWLGNPCPGVLKTLRIRYVSLEGVAKGRRREVWLQESEVRPVPFGWVGSAQRTHIHNTIIYIHCCMKKSA